MKSEALAWKMYREFLLCFVDFFFEGSFEGRVVSLNLWLSLKVGDIKNRSHLQITTFKVGHSLFVLRCFLTFSTAFHSHDSFDPFNSRQPFLEIIYGRPLKLRSPRFSQPRCKIHKLLLQPDNKSSSFMRHENFISARECNNFSLLPLEGTWKSLKQNSFARTLVPWNCYFFEWNITLHNIAKKVIAVTCWHTSCPVRELLPSINLTMTNDNGAMGAERAPRSRQKPPRRSSRGNRKSCKCHWV